MEKEFIPYEQALELKELGFDEPLLGRFYTKPKCKMFGIDEKGRHYPIKNTPKKLYILGKHFVLNDDNVTIAPLYQQVFRWLRNKYDIDFSVLTTYSKYNENTIKQYSGVIDNKTMYTNVGFYDNYEEAELAGLQKMIKIIEKE
jgi:hypothetical protein